MADRPATYHWIRLRAVAHPTEDLGRVRQAVRFVAGGDVVLHETQLETHHGLPQTVVECVLERSREVRGLLGRLFALAGALDQFRAELDRRTDDDGVFYARADKQEAYAGRLVLTGGEDCVQLRLKVEAYPAGREAALKVLDAVLASGRP
jgi:hypothetical protein